MGLTIELQDEFGNARHSVADRQDQLHGLLPSNDDRSFPMLTSIDPYGDTTFNGKQMDRFLAEWAEISARANKPEERALVATIETYARRCQAEVHLYLKFIGD